MKILATDIRRSMYNRCCYTGSTSFKITVVRIVRVQLVIERRVRSTCFSITSLGRVQFPLLVIKIECLHKFYYHRPKIVVIRAIIDVMRLLLRYNNHNM